MDGGGDCGGHGGDFGGDHGSHSSHDHGGGGHGSQNSAHSDDAWLGWFGWMWGGPSGLETPMRRGSPLARRMQTVRHVFLTIIAVIVALLAVVAMWQVGAAPH